MNTTQEDILAKWNRETTPDIRAVALDETEYWIIPEKYQPYIERIEGVYFYDKNEHTYICSFTPHYWLRHIENRAILKADIPEDVRDRIDEEIYDWIMESNIGEESDYFNKYSIDRFEENNKDNPSRYKPYPFDQYDDMDYDTYDAYMESWREFFSGNEPMG